MERSDGLSRQSTGISAEVEYEDKYQKMMRELKETRERVAQTLARSSQLKSEIQDTLEKSKAVDDRFEQFKADFGNVMSSLVRNMQEAYGGLDQ